MKTEKEIREALKEFQEENKGNFLQINEVKAITRVFKWILEEKE